jgi:isopentenyl-diphosphate delta-isomerase
VADWKWMTPEKIKKDISDNPEMYTVWFKIIFEKFYEHLVMNHQIV